jgi:hypothetical protein
MSANRWRRAGVWSGIMNALAAPHDAAVQMIDTSIIRVHQAIPLSLTGSLGLAHFLPGNWISGRGFFS